MMWTFGILCGCMATALGMGYYLGTRDSDLSYSARRELRRVTRQLRKAVAANRQLGTGGRFMGNTILDTLATEVTETIGVIQSAVTLINGFKDRQAAAIAEALANGATAEQLQPLYDLNAALDTASTSLAEAVAANS